MSIYEITNAQYVTYLTEALASDDITATSSTVEGKTGSWSGQEYLDIDDSECDIDYSAGTFTIRDNRENKPVAELPWYGAKAFAVYYGLDLPTEAEWEYACRAGTETKYYTGNNESDLGRAGWYEVNRISGETTSSVGQKEPNEFGLFDMHGNVWEWCNDWYGDYPSGSVINPTGPSTGSNRIMRGGDYMRDAGVSRSAFRYEFGPTNSYGNIGFRVVRRP